MRDATSLAVLEHVVFGAYGAARAKETVHARRLVIEAREQTGVEVVVEEQQAHVNDDGVNVLRVLLVGFVFLRATQGIHLC